MADADRGGAPGVGVPRPDRYEVRELLGSGSTGVVYRVYDRLSDRELALKTLVRDDPEDLLLLKREFRALMRVFHPNVVRLYDLEVDGSRGYFTMELVEGGSLVEALAARGGRARDPAAVRHSFLQLASGLSEIHAHGLLHRDVKPANVRVDPVGRVVLLDFGLALGTAHELSLRSREQVAGTLAYMAPEQAWGRASLASDWYSVGVMLYECLAGSLPFEGPSLAALLDRERPPATPPQGRAAEADPALVALALDLLSYEPERRPDGEEVRRRLEGSATTRATPRRARSAAPFVNRQEECRRLRAAWARTRAGRAALVRVEGPSGIGKSALVARALAEREEEGALVLRSSCHVQASVPFEALDGCVDELSRFLLHAAPEEREAVRPRGLRALQRVFPVLARVPFERLEWEPDFEGSDPAELRRAAVTALGELLARIAARRPLALWIDDFQWGDRDSVPFLLELLGRPDAPPLRVVLSERDDEREKGDPLLDPLLEAGAGEGLELETLSVGPLEESSVAELLRELLDDADEERIRALATQAEGSPLFALQLASSPRLSSEPGTRLELAEVLRDRLTSLPGESLDLLRWAAVAGRPLDTSLLLDVAGVGRRGRAPVYDLCRLGWLRPVVDQNRIDVLHDRIREVVLANIPEPERRSRHLRLARVLAARPAPDASAVYAHYRIADRPEAAEWALRTAREAASGLAFDRAAAMFRETFTLRGSADADWALLEREAEALAAGGRSSASAHAYRGAARAAVRAGAPALEATRLRGSAAQQHLYAGELEEGTRLLRGVLDALGLGAPRSVAARQRRALRCRARFLLGEATGRVDRCTRSAGAPLEPSALLRLDILQGASRGLAMLDPSLADALTAQHLLAAIRVGEPSRLLRALGLEAGIEANVGGAWLRRHAAALLDRVDALAERTADPYDRAWALIVRSNVAWFNAQWRECVIRGEEAVEWLRSRCIGIQWERTSNELFTLSAQAQMGELEAVRHRIPALLEDARRRGDAYAVSTCRTGDAGFLALADDAPERGLRDAAEAGRPYGGGEFNSLHYYYLYPWAQIQIYRGTPDVAWAAFTRAWPALQRAGFLRLDCIGNGMRHLRSRAALALAAGTPESERAPLLRVVRRDVRRIARSTLPQSAGNASLLRGGLAALDGDAATAARELRAAADRLERAEMYLYSAAARWQAAAFIPSAEAHDLRETAGSVFSRQGVRRPERFAATLVPADG